MKKQELVKGVAALYNNQIAVAIGAKEYYVAKKGYSADFLKFLKSNVYVSVQCSVKKDVVEIVEYDETLLIYGPGKYVFPIAELKPILETGKDLVIVKDKGVYIMDMKSKGERKIVYAKNTLDFQDGRGSDFCDHLPKAMVSDLKKICSDESLTNIIFNMTEKSMSATAE